jgi:Leu/Phe-tRNA-protein transferase
MSNNIARKIRRKKSIKNIKNLKSDMKNQVGLFRLMPEECVLCGANFDKKSREDHMTWRVAVNEEFRKVILVCPNCQEKDDEENSSP